MKRRGVTYLFACHGGLIAVWQLHDHSQRPSSRHDGSLMDRVTALCHERHEGVSSFVEGSHTHGLRGNNRTLAL